MNDITYGTGIVSNGITEIQVSYAGKKIYTGRIFSADVPDFKAAIASVQVELLKELVKQNTEL